VHEVQAAGVAVERLHAGDHPSPVTDVAEEAGTRDLRTALRLAHSSSTLSPQ
jgi:hypothetical protein